MAVAMIFVFSSGSGLKHSGTGILLHRRSDDSGCLVALGYDRHTKKPEGPDHPEGADNSLRSAKDCCTDGWKAWRVYF